MIESNQFLLDLPSQNSPSIPTPVCCYVHQNGSNTGLPPRRSPPMPTLVKALVWFWLIDETLSANLVYQSGYEIGSTTPSDEEIAKIMTMVMAW